jgi:hypothetical protein
VQGDRQEDGGWVAVGVGVKTTTVCTRAVHEQLSSYVPAVGLKAALRQWRPSGMRAAGSCGLVWLACHTQPFPLAGCMVGCTLCVDTAHTRGQPPTHTNTWSWCVCSLQVMDPAVMYAHGPAFAGRPVLFREAPFLHNSRSPSWIRHAATTISSGAPAGCPEEGAPCAQVLTGKPPPGINQQVGPGMVSITVTHCTTRHDHCPTVVMPDCRLFLQPCWKPTGGGGGSKEHNADMRVQPPALRLLWATVG